MPALTETLNLADRADFCVGYFNLRGWKQIDSFIERWSGGEGNCCRLLVGMQRVPQEELRAVMGLIRRGEEIDNQTALRLKKKLAEEFREQLSWGVPVLLALCTALLAKSLKGGLVTAGGLNLGGGLDPVHNAVSIAELAVEKGATTLLIPISARKQLNELSDEMVMKLSILYYADVKEALIKALGD